MVKHKIRWSTDAKLDLLNILEFYITRNGNATYSHRLHQKINSTIRLISKHPLIGIKTNIDSVKTFITEDYQIIYEIYDQFILIIMIWDCRRNPEDRNINRRIR